VLSDDMWDILAQFYAWARAQDPSDVGYPHVDPVRKLLGGAVGGVLLTDEEAVHIDNAISRLRLERPDEYAVLDLVHCKGLSLRKMERMGIGSRRQNAALLSNAHTYLRDILHVNF